MINYWWVTRPKRRLNSIPEVLAVISNVTLNMIWKGQRNIHLLLEEALEDAGIKRKGLRRDRTGGGGRTYLTWVESLGLVFTQEATGETKLTLAGEAIMAGDPPAEILKQQVMKFQYPSYFALAVNISSRFRIRPFRFLLKLLTDIRLDYYITEEEIAKVIMVEAENETDACYNSIVDKLLIFRSYGDMCLAADFVVMYKTGKNDINTEHPYEHLKHTANTIVNWLEYTQLAKRDDDPPRHIKILEDKRLEVKSILSTLPLFIDRPEQHEYFQRKYGVDPKHTKDTRNLTDTRTVTDRMITEQKIKQCFITESLKQPIIKITISLIDRIVELTGIDVRIVEETLHKNYPHGAIGPFMAEYFELAFRGKDEAIAFEKATAEIFANVFGFKAYHVGPKGKSPDVLILSDIEGYQAIIDNKAYSKYSITNDHRNRMVHNYIGGFSSYSDSLKPLVFFSYIAGGFTTNISAQIKEIKNSTGVCGSALNVTGMINLIKNNEEKKYTHAMIRDVFSVNRLIQLSDL